MLEYRVAALAFAFGSAPQAVIAAPCALSAKPETVAVERVLDGDTLTLDDGRTVRLAGIAAPKAPLGTDAARWPLGEGSREALEEIAGGRVLELRAAAPSTDRRGRLLAYMTEIGAKDHAEIASAMLARGLARLSADPPGRGCGATLAEAEAGAIRARLGLWSEPYYAVRDAAGGSALSAEAGRFVVAEGRVASVRTSAGRAYVNFSERWRDALSLVFSEAALRRFGGFEGLGIRTGARLRARGVVESRLGPSIFVTERAQVERLDGPAR